MASATLSFKDCLEREAVIQTIRNAHGLDESCEVTIRERSSPIPCFSCWSWKNMIVAMVDIKAMNGQPVIYVGHVLCCEKCMRVGRIWNLASWLQGNTQ